MRLSARPVCPLCATRKLRIPFLLATITLAACVCAGGTQPQQLTPERATAVDRAVRAMMQNVAHGVTQDGPLTWLKYFDSTPAFFMAVNGEMAFPNPAAAQEGTRKFAETIRHIELKWGDDLRVDPLTSNLAVVGTTWHEVQIDNAGHQANESGYFTALVENRDGHWQFRDAHWSAPVPICH